MNFKPDLADKVMDGQKTVTRRIASDNPRSPWWHERTIYQPGKVFTVNPGRGKVNIGRARVVCADLIDLGTIDLDEARMEGFASVQAFFDAFHVINKGKAAQEAETLVWRIGFEVVPAEDMSLWERAA